jgi:hypothetical protein
VAKIATGMTSCTANNQCLSGYCLGGICCAGACSTSDATCGAMSCASGTGRCVYPAALTYCNNDFQQCTGASLNMPNVDVCDGAGTCHAIMYTCSAGNSCNGHPGGICNTCSIDADCTAYGYCKGTPGTCWPKGQAGATCGANNQCLSGMCSGGTCQ